MTQQEQFEADYLAAFATKWPKGYSTDFGRTENGYQMPVIDNMFRVWLQQAKRHEAEIAELVGALKLGRFFTIEEAEKASELIAKYEGDRK